MKQNELQIKISAQDDASKIINLVGTAFEAAANDIANMVAKTNLAKVAMDALNANVKTAAVRIGRFSDDKEWRKFCVV